jgi:GMP synthase-like glutamine amidotransferase
MKRMLVLQHLTSDGPGELATFLNRQAVGFDVFDTQAGDAYPERIDGYSGLAVLGGEMSANDDLPSLRQAERLILEAMDRGVPVLGHCLGGQLMARALGAPVSRNRVPEIGWHPIAIAPEAEARAWLGDDPAPTVFQWHSETFALPREARLLASSEACAHQAFSIGPHLAMQFHIELDEAKLARWSADRHPDYLAMQRLQPATVQSGEAMRAAASTSLPAARAIAHRIYARWLASAP